MDSDKLQGYLDALNHRDEIEAHLIAGIEANIESLTKLGLSKADIAAKLSVPAAKTQRKPRARNKAKAATNA